MLHLLPLALKFGLKWSVESKFCHRHTKLRLSWLVAEDLSSAKRYVRKFDFSVGFQDDELLIQAFQGV